MPVYNSQFIAQGLFVDKMDRLARNLEDVYPGCDPRNSITKAFVDGLVTQEEYTDFKTIFG